MTIVIEGFDELVTDLRQIGQVEALREINKELRPVAALIRVAAERGAPRHSGRLARSIRVGTRNRAPAVIVKKTDVPYAKSVEFSGRHPFFGDRTRWFDQPVDPFIGPAVDLHLDDVARAAETGLDAALRKAGFK